jgi:chemotaxis protein CheD
MKSPAFHLKFTRGHPNNEDRPVGPRCLGMSQRCGPPQSGDFAQIFPHAMPPAAPPGLGSLFAQRVVVGVGDMAVSNSANAILTTYALGSCIGLIAFDPVTKASGLLHYMLPESTISPEKAKNQPAMFADTGLPGLFRAFTGVKGDVRRAKFFVAGGASVLNGSDPFKIGERNIQALEDYFRANGLRPTIHDVGGTYNRTISIVVSSGAITMKTPTGTTQHSLA